MKQKGICMKRIIYIVTACAFLSVSTAKAQQVLTLKECLEEGLQNNYSLRIVHNEEQISKNNATLGNAGYFPTLDFSAGYTGNLDNIESKARATGEITKNNGVYDQTVNVGLNLNWTIFDGFNISTTYKQLKELERQGETNTRIAIEDFIADLTSEYYNFIQQKIRLKNFHYAMSLSKERLRIAKASHLVGKFSGLDYQQAKVDFNADSAQYIKQQELLHSSRIQLNELMANKNVNFANREVADLMLKDYSTKKMFLNVDWANVTSTSFEGDRVFATGGQGAPNRVQFDGSRTGTLTIEAQVYPVKVFQMLSGNDLGTEANFLKREKVTAADTTKLTLSEAAAGDYVQVFKADDDLGTELEATVSGKEVTVTVENGVEYVVYYYKKAAKAQVVHLDSRHFPKAYRVEGSIPYKTENDDIIEAHPIWYKAAPQAGFELSWQNTGDPVSLTMTFDVLADENGDMFSLIFPNEG